MTDIQEFEKRWDKKFSQLEKELDALLLKQARISRKQQAADELEAKFIKAGIRI